MFLYIMPAVNYENKDCCSDATLLPKTYDDEILNTFKYVFYLLMSYL